MKGQCFLSLKKTEKNYFSFSQDFVSIIQNGNTQDYKFAE